MKTHWLMVTAALGLSFLLSLSTNIGLAQVQVGVPPSTTGWIWSCNPVYGWTNCSIFIPQIRKQDEKAEVQLQWDKGLPCAPDWSCSASGDGIYYLAKDENGELLKKEFKLGDTIYYIPYFQINLFGRCVYKECWSCYYLERTIYVRVRLLDAKGNPTTPWTDWMYFKAYCSKQECTPGYKDYWR